MNCNKKGLEDQKGDFSLFVKNSNLLNIYTPKSFGATHRRVLVFAYHPHITKMSADPELVQAFLKACVQLKLDDIKALLEKDDTLKDCKTKYGTPCIMQVVRMKRRDSNLHHEVFDFLASAGADITAQDSDNVNSLDIAAKNIDLYLIKKLVAAGLQLKPDHAHQVTADYNVDETGAVEFLKMLIEAGVDCNTKEYGSSGPTPIISVAIHGPPEMMELLLKAVSPTPDQTQHLRTCANRNKKHCEAIFKLLDAHDGLPEGTTKKKLGKIQRGCANVQFIVDKDESKPYKERYRNSGEIWGEDLSKIPFDNKMTVATVFKGIPLDTEVEIDRMDWGGRNEVECDLDEEVDPAPGPRKIVMRGHEFSVSEDATIIQIVCSLERKKLLSWTQPW